MLIRAMIIATVLSSGAAYLHWGTTTEPVTIGADLQDLPYALGDWSGVEAPRFDEEIVRVLGVDEYIHRVYRRAGGPVWLYVGFYGRQGAGETIHSPLNCLPGAGWEPIQQARATLKVIDQQGASIQIDVNQLVIEKGATRQVVLYWYQSHGRVTGSEYRSKLFAALDALWLRRSDGAIVRVIAPIYDDSEAAAGLARRFAADLYPQLSGVLPL